VPEMNLGQLAMLLRAHYPVDVISYNQVRGMPFTTDELSAAIREAVDDLEADPADALARAGAGTTRGGGR